MFLKKGLPVILAVAGIMTIVINTPAAKTEDEQQLNGSYYVTLVLDGTPPLGPFAGLVTYTSDGIAIANEIVPLAGTPLEGATLTEDHGGWNRIGDGRFAVTFVKLASSGGTFLAYIRNRATVNLSQDTNQFSGRFRTDILAPDGKTVLFSAPGTITGKRIPVEPFPG